MLTLYKIELFIVTIETMKCCYKCFFFFFVNCKTRPYLGAIAYHNNLKIKKELLSIIIFHIITGGK